MKCQDTISNSGNGATSSRTNTTIFGLRFQVQEREVLSSICLYTVPDQQPPGQAWFMYGNETTALYTLTSAIYSTTIGNKACYQLPDGQYNVGVVLPGDYYYFVFPSFGTHSEMVLNAPSDFSISTFSFTAFTFSTQDGNIFNTVTTDSPVAFDLIVSEACDLVCPYPMVYVKQDGSCGPPPRAAYGCPPPFVSNDNNTGCVSPPDGLNNCQYPMTLDNNGRCVSPTPQPPPPVSPGTGAFVSAHLMDCQCIGPNQYCQMSFPSRLQYNVSCACLPGYTMESQCNQRSADFCTVSQCPQPSSSCQTVTCVANATSDQMCQTASQPDGTPCVGDDITTTNSVCQAGVCVGSPVQTSCASVAWWTMDIASMYNALTNNSVPLGSGLSDAKALKLCVPDVDAIQNAAQSTNQSDWFDIVNQSSPAFKKVVIHNLNPLPFVGICTNVSCPARSQCEQPGTCDPTTGLCLWNLQPDGTPCDDGLDITINDTCTKGVCAGVKACDRVVCAAQDTCHNIGVCDFSTGLCNNPAKRDGALCDDGNAQTVQDQCQSGVCKGIPKPSEDKCATVLCPNAPSQCLDNGGCDPSSGHCLYVLKSNGATCDDKNPLTVSDSCWNGVCVGVNPCDTKDCSSVGQCHAVGICNRLTGNCSSPALPDGSFCDDGDATTVDSCVAGVCHSVKIPALNRCNTTKCVALGQCYDVGTCDPTTGRCPHPMKLDGTSCDDGDARTTNDQCTNGKCVGENLCANVHCTAIDSCHSVGTCDFITGACSTPLRDDGSLCDDNMTTTVGDQCVSGVCQGTPVSDGDKCTGVTCTPKSPCGDVGVCNPQTGECGKPIKPDGSVCSMAVTGAAGQCASGICRVVQLCTLVECVPLGVCYEVGTCDPATGTCSNPMKVTGAACDDGDATTTGDQCNQGVCAGVAKGQTDLCASVSCTATDQCQDVGACDPTTGRCKSVLRPDGTACNDEDPTTDNDACRSGVCKGVVPAPVVVPRAHPCLRDYVVFCYDSNTTNTRLGCLLQNYASLSPLCKQFIDTNVGADGSKRVCADAAKSCSNQGDNTDLVAIVKCLKQNASLPAACGTLVGQILQDLACAAFLDANPRCQKAGSLAQQFKCIVKLPNVPAVCAGQLLVATPCALERVLLCDGIYNLDRVQQCLMDNANLGSPLISRKCQQRLDSLTSASGRKFKTSAGLVASEFVMVSGSDVTTDDLGLALSPSTVTPPPQPPPANNSPGKTGLGLPIIVAIAVGGGVLLMLVVAAIGYAVTKKKPAVRRGELDAYQRMEMQQK